MTPESCLDTYEPLVQRLAQYLRQRLPAHSVCDVEDLCQAGRLGLLEALDRYDPAREATFTTYAEHRIRGAMLDALRALDWLPRHVRADAEATAQASTGLAQHLHTLAQETAPSPEDLLLAREHVAVCAARIGALPPQERDVLRATAQGLSQQAMAAPYGVTPSRISQIRRRALERLKAARTGA